MSEQKPTAEAVRAAEQITANHIGKNDDGHYIKSLNPYSMKTRLVHDIATALAAKDAEIESWRYKWDAEYCDKCDYMRSPVASCKCGQLAIVGTNDLLRGESQQQRALLVEAVRLIKMLRGGFCDCNGSCQTCKFLSNPAVVELLKGEVGSE